MSYTLILKRSRLAMIWAISLLFMTPAFSQTPQKGDSTSIEAVMMEVAEGSFSERSLPGAMSKINPIAVEQNAVNRLEQAFNGTLTGLYSVRTAGQTFGFSNLDYFLRGKSTTGSNAPLILVDGIDANINLLDPLEIESITVLKDASELAIYGLRGANGVILIKTKDGNPLKSYMRLDGRMGIQSPAYMADKLNAYNYTTLHNEANLNDGALPVFDAENYLNSTNPFLYPDVDFPDQFLKDQSIYQQYTFSTGGGNEIAQYYALVGYMKENGLFDLPEGHDNLRRSNNERYNFRSNLKVDLGKGFMLNSRMAAIFDERRSPWMGGSNSVDASNNLFFNSLMSTPANAFPLINPNGSLGGTSEYRGNPVGILSSGQRREDTRQLTANVKLDKDLGAIIEGLSSYVLYGFENYNAYYKGSYTSFAVYQAIDDTTYAEYGADDTKVTNVGSQMSDYYSNTTFKAGMEFDRRFGEHQVEGTAVFSQHTSRRGGDTPAFKWLGTSGRLLYGFSDRYYAQLTAAYQGSNNYASGQRYGFFPAFGVGWIISEEAFLKPIQSIDYLKLKASYGVVGNDRTGGSRFMHRQSYYNGNGYGFGNPNGTTQGSYEGTLGNPDATWERAYMSNVGMELQVLKNSLSMSVNYFHETRRDILINQANITPDLIGVSLPQYNAGEIINQGYEADFSYTKKLGALVLTVGGNVLLAQNEIVDLNEIALPENETYRYRRGNAINARFGFVADGIYASQAAINDHGIISSFGILKPGDLKYLDQNGDGVIDEADKTVIGNAFPELMYGLNFGLEIKGFDLYVQALGAGMFETHVRPDQFSTYAFDNRWQEGQNAYEGLFPRLSFESNHNRQTSTFWQENTQLLRLSTIEMGYTLPKRWANKIATSSIRIYSNLNNVFSTGTEKEGRDLEIPQAGYTAYPLMKTMVFGLSVNL